MNTFVKNNFFLRAIDEKKKLRFVFRDGNVGVYVIKAKDDEVVLTEDDVLIFLHDVSMVRRK